MTAKFVQFVISLQFLYTVYGGWSVIMIRMLEIMIFSVLSNLLVFLDSSLCINSRFFQVLLGVTKKEYLNKLPRFCWVMHDCRPLLTLWVQPLTFCFIHSYF